MSATPLENIAQQPLHLFTEQAYLNYSMYVILDRALPHISDGLKPVQRRIVYAMSQLGLNAGAKFKKSARTVGDVLGKFHPHGDTACYEAMVLMAQSFSYRYPLVFGQGNWGSVDDPKSFAAMRYTEAKLTQYADVLLSELGHGTVDWIPNFDGTLDEPARLPARLPNVLLNGSTGIAVGMATDVPPHNLREVANACVHLLEHPRATLNDLCKHIKAPDFPTEAEIITPKQDMLDIYQKGTGTIKMRAVYEKEDDEIIITALPHQTAVGKALTQIASQIQSKKIPMLTGLRDESDHENPVRIVLSLRSNRVDSKALMSHLFASTDLERNYRVNFNVIGLDGRPQVKNLQVLLKEWLTYRMETVKRRLQHRLDKVLVRLHILDGLLIAYLNLDEVIKIIRTEDEPKQKLIKRFKLSEIQAEAILETKLRHLAKLEEMKIKGEQAELEKEKQEIEKILGSSARLKTLIKKEIQADAKKYGDDRRSPLVEREDAQVFSETQTFPSDPVTVVLSQKGWVRAGKGHEINGQALNYKAGDQFLAQAQGRMNQPVIALDSNGRSYTLPTHDLPSVRSQGEPLTSRLKPADQASFKTVISSEKEDLYLLASSAGYGFIVKFEELHTKNRSGKAVVKVPEGSQLLRPKKVEDIESQYLAAVTSEGRLLLFPVADLPILSKGKGNKIINMPTSKTSSGVEYLVDIAILNENDALILATTKRKLTLKPKDLALYQGLRGRRGNKLPRGFSKIEYLEYTPRHSCEGGDLP